MPRLITGLGGALARAALSGFLAAAREIAMEGSFTRLARSIRFDEINRSFDQGGSRWRQSVEPAPERVPYRNTTITAAVAWVGYDSATGPVNHDSTRWPTCKSEKPIRVVPALLFSRITASRGTLT